MADPERFDAERADLQIVARVERQQRVVVEPVLLDLDPEQPLASVDAYTGTPGKYGRMNGSPPT